ncbi:MAG: hypothetical protein CEE41_05160 [Hadesarchaea archaeon B3_Hades]|nr:MAG: hypothetical protein CEE41_05160 [Hadesarchaea archaeon B3_Hades]
MAIGDIVGVIQTLTDDEQGLRPHIAYRGGNIGVLVIRGPDNHGWVKSFSVSDAGELSADYIGALEFDGVTCDRPRVIHISGDVFAVVYEGVDHDGWLKTFSVNAAGAIAGIDLVGLEFDDAAAYDPKICHVSGNTFAIAYTDNANDPRVKTVSISGAGAIAGIDLVGLVIGAASGAQPDICHVSGEIFAVAYNGDLQEHTIATFTISGDGTIGGAVIDTTVFDTEYGTQFSLATNGTGMVAIAYLFDWDNSGKLTTVTIDGEGNISAVKDTFALDADACIEPEIITFRDGFYAIVYQGVAGDGFLKTIGIDAGGNIDAAPIGTLEFETVDSSYPSIAHIAGDTYAIGSCDASGATPFGKIHTVGIITSLIWGRAHMMGML